MKRVVRHNFPGLYAGLALSAALAAIGFWIMEESGSLIVMYLSCVLFVAFCVYHGVGSIFVGEVNIGSLLCSQTIFWYALPFTYAGFFEYNDYIFFPTEADNALSSLIVIFVCLSCFVPSELFGTTIRLSRNFTDEQAALVAIVIPLAAIQTYLLVTGGWGYTTAVGAAVFTPGVDANPSQPVYLQGIRSLSPAIAPLCAAFVGSLLAKNHYRRKHTLLMVGLFGAVLLVQLLWWSSVGRRQMTIIIVISALAFFSFYFRGRISFRKLVTIALVGAASIPALWFLWEGYYLLRLATNAMGGSGNLTIIDLVEASDWASATEVRGLFLENMFTRPFLIVTSLTIVRETASGMLLGWNFLSQVLLTIPSAVFPGKLEFIGPVLETLWHQELAVPMKDWSNSLFAESYIDFGIYGFPIYILAVSALAKLLARWADLIQFKTANAFLFFAFAYGIFSIETSVNDLFVLARSVAIICVVTMVLSLFRARKRAVPYALSVNQKAP